MSAPNIGRILNAALGRRGLTQRVIKKEVLNDLVECGKLGDKSYGDFVNAIKAIKTSGTVSQTQMQKFERALVKSLDSKKRDKRINANKVLMALKEHDSAQAKKKIQNVDAAAAKAPNSVFTPIAPDLKVATIDLKKTDLTAEEIATFQMLERRENAMIQDNTVAGGMRPEWGVFSNTKHSQFSNLKYATHSIVGGDNSVGHKVVANTISVEGQQIGFASQYPTKDKLPDFFEYIIKHNVAGIHNLASDYDIKVKSPSKNQYYFKILVEQSDDEAASKSKHGFVVNSRDNSITVSKEGIRLSDGSRAKVSSVHKKTIPQTKGLNGEILSLKADIYELRIEHKGKVMAVPVLHTPEWPDHGATNAQTLTDIVNLRKQVFGAANLLKVNTHCRAGVGRTGTVICAEHMYNKGASLEATIKGVRHSRSPIMVQTDVQSLSLIAFARLHGLTLTESAQASKQAAPIPDELSTVFQDKEYVWRYISADEANLNAYIEAHGQAKIADAMIDDLVRRAGKDRQSEVKTKGKLPSPSRPDRADSPSLESDSDDTDRDYDSDTSPLPSFDNRAHGNANKLKKTPLLPPNHVGKTNKASPNRDTEALYQNVMTQREPIYVNLPPRRELNKTATVPPKKPQPAPKPASTIREQVAKARAVAPKTESPEWLKELKARQIKKND